MRSPGSVLLTRPSIYRELLSFFFVVLSLLQTLVGSLKVHIRSSLKAKDALRITYQGKILGELPLVFGSFVNMLPHC